MVTHEFPWALVWYSLISATLKFRNEALHRSLHVSSRMRVRVSKRGLMPVIDVRTRGYCRDIISIFVVSQVHREGREGYDPGRWTHILKSVYKSCQGGAVSPIPWKPTLSFSRPVTGPRACNVTALDGMWAKLWDKTQYTLPDSWDWVRYEISSGPQDLTVMPRGVSFPGSPHPFHMGGSVCSGKFR